MKIAVYSGSFNPLHIGHQAIMEYLTREHEFDWVYLVISPQNPFKDASNALSGRERYEAAVEAVARHPELRVRVDDIELTMAPPQYTIRTLDALKMREPEKEFTFVMGADNLAGIRGWRDFRRILSDYGVVVYPRDGYDAEALRASLLEECSRHSTPESMDAAQGGMLLEDRLRRSYRIRLVDAPMVDISSTRIREGRAQGLDMNEYLM